MFNDRWKVMADYGPQKLLDKYYPQPPVCLSSWWSKSFARKLATHMQQQKPQFKYYIERIK